MKIYLKKQKKTRQENSNSKDFNIKSDSILGEEEATLTHKFMKMFPIFL